MENQQIINGAIVIIMASLIGYVYIGQTDDFGVPLQEPTHKCVDKMIAYHCDSLSKYYSLPNGKCWNSVDGNRLCRSGWEEIIIEVETSKASTSGEREHCISKGCI